MINLGHYVAPHAGAWIETMSGWKMGYQLWVAPHAGAWIETVTLWGASDLELKSRPTRARGLKPPIL